MLFWVVKQRWCLITDVSGPIGCPETLVNKSRPSVRNNPEERRQLNRGGSLKYLEAFLCFSFRASEGSSVKRYYEFFSASPRYGQRLLPESESKKKIFLVSSF
jgi:hypothetical protein